MVAAAASPAVVATDLLSYVNKLLDLSAKPLELTQEIKKSDWSAVVAAVAPKAEALLALEVETDVEGCFSMLFDVLRQLPAEQAAAEGKKLLAVVVAKSDDKIVLRARIASTLFNKAAGLPELRFATLLALIKYASETDSTELVSSYFDDVESLFEASTLTAERRRQLYLTIADVLVKSDAKSIKVLFFLDKYLATFAGADEKQAAAGKDVAARAVKLVLQRPVASFVARVDIAANPAVRALKADAKTAKLLELLDIVSTKTLQEYTAFHKAAGASFFADNGLSHEELTSTMRLFTLCSLPTGFDEVPFEKIAGALAIDEDDVEKWIVKAITSNLVTAKVDQLRRTVVITRVLQRGFGAEQWSEIHAKLQLYKKNVGALLDVALERALKGSVYSRAPSRVSSRAASRFGGGTSVSGLSWALSGGHRAMKFARLALSLAGDDRRDLWEADSASTKSKPRVFSTEPSQTSPTAAISSSRYSLASNTARTSRVPVDYAEYQRREEIVRDLASREARDELSARIQRKGNLRLRLRSMLDPSLSVDQEEREAATKSRSGPRNPSNASPHRRASGSSDSQLAAPTTRSHETTYRPEDYEGLDSGVVVVEPRGELLIGENCVLVARKTREDLRRDLVTRTNIQPRIHVPLSAETAPAPVVEPPIEPTRSSPPRARPGGKSPVEQKPPASPQHPVFAGQIGSFQSYPKIELDPKKTPLTKGVVIKAPSVSTTPMLAPAALDSPEMSKKTKPTRKKMADLLTAIARVAEDSSNDALDREVSAMLQSTPKPATAQLAGGDAPASRPVTRGALASRSGGREPPLSAVRVNQGHHETQLHSLRTRTPAYGNRTPSRIPAVLALSRHDETDELGDKAVSPSALPRVNYTRGFPSPTPGKVHISSPEAAAAALKMPDQRTSLFGSLPTVLRGKR
ncbi:hypothetical protein P43SY_001150 [Pythium insidiosum]|uniref:Eukaryotic translation initiation factor 3 subunit M n=1 Tax=Pythium insidiosum TaxID=114742 RepID=A0AAD5LU52_PYTIN|nr:hypothetical protein P43SY_001150 [Pythium insidiosum]